MIENHSQDIELDSNDSQIDDLGKALLVFFGTPLIYYFWYFLLENAPSISIDLTVMSNETITFIISFWVITLIYLVLAFAVLYAPLFKYHKNQDKLNLSQSLNLTLSSVFSVFFCIAVWFWHKFIFSSDSIIEALRGIFVFSCLILGVFGVIQFWLSVMAMQIVEWIKSKIIASQD